MEAEDYKCVTDLVICVRSQIGEQAPEIGEQTPGLMRAAFLPRVADVLNVLTLPCPARAQKKRSIRRDCNCNCAKEKTQRQAATAAACRWFGVLGFKNQRHETAPHQQSLHRYTDSTRRGRAPWCARFGRLRNSKQDTDSAEDERRLFFLR